MKQKLSRQARADKKVRDEKYMREVYNPKKKFNQRKRRADIKAGKNLEGLDYDDKDNKYKTVKANRGNDGKGTKNE